MAALAQLDKEYTTRFHKDAPSLKLHNRIMRKNIGRVTTAIPTVNIRSYATCLFALLTWSAFLVRCSAATYNVRNAPYNAVGDGVADDYPAIQHAVRDAIAAGSGNIVYIPGGTYLLGHNSVVDINHANGLTVKGDTNTEILNDNSGNGLDDIAINGSTNVRVTQLKLDVKTLRSTQGVINSLSPDGKTLSATLDEGFQGLDASMFQPGSDGKYSVDCWIWTDPSSLMFDQNEGGPGDISVAPVHLGGRQWQVKLNTHVSNDVIGKRVSFLKEGGSWGIGIYDCYGPVTIDHVVDYGGGGAGAAFGMGRDTGPITFSYVTIGVPPSSNRLFATAGGFDYQGNRGVLTIDNCNFSHTKDDILDCGTELAHILEHPSPNVIVVANGSRYFVGDRLQIWDWTRDHQTVRDTATIVQADHGQNDDPWTLTLDKAVVVNKTGSSPGDYVQVNDGIDRCCDINNAGPCIFTNNKVQSSGRILNFKAANSTISHNYFYQIGWCINAEAEPYWHGGPAPMNLTISDNLFVDVGWEPINVAIGGSYADHGGSNITIENNRFRNCGAHEAFSDGLFTPMCDIRGGGIRVTSADGVIIRGNKFNGNWGPSIVVQNSRSIDIRDNSIYNAGQHTWKDFNNYTSYNTKLDMGADIFLDGVNGVKFSHNTVDRLGPYNTKAVEATDSCKGIDQLTAGVLIGR